MTTQTRDQPPVAASATRRPFALAVISLALGAFFIATGEFASMSLLPDMAATTNVSIPDAGWYVSSYAIGVVVGAPLIAVTAARRDKKMIIIAVLALFVLGYTASAFAWDAGSLLAARFVAGLPHGAYFGSAILAATALAPASRRAQTAGYVMLGLAVANVVGVPVATWLGQVAGWRIAFAAMALGGLFSVIAVLVTLPRVPADQTASARAELRGLRNGSLWLTLGVASVGFGGMFAVYSYITPTLTERAGLELSLVPAALLVFGIGMVVGNLVGGWLADRRLTPSIFGMLAWNAAAIGLFTSTSASAPLAIATLFLIGCGFALVPALQVRLMNLAGEAQGLAASLNHSAFNLANALGAWMAGLTIAAGWGWQSTGIVGAALAVAGLTLMAAVVWHERRGL